MLVSDGYFCAGIAGFRTGPWRTYLLLVQLWPASAVVHVS
jgi:hypothetical protein